MLQSVLLLVLALLTPLGAGWARSDATWAVLTESTLVSSAPPSALELESLESGALAEGEVEESRSEVAGPDNGDGDLDASVFFGSEFVARLPGSHFELSRELAALAPRGADERPTLLVTLTSASPRGPPA